MTREMILVRMTLEGKYKGLISARDYAFEKMSQNTEDEELRRLYENMYKEYAYKAGVVLDLIDEIKGVVRNGSKSKRSGRKEG